VCDRRIDRDPHSSCRSLAPSRALSRASVCDSVSDDIGFAKWRRGGRRQASDGRSLNSVRHAVASSILVNIRVIGALCARIWRAYARVRACNYIESRLIDPSGPAADTSRRKALRERYRLSASDRDSTREKFLPRLITPLISRSQCCRACRFHAHSVQALIFPQKRLAYTSDVSICHGYYPQF